MRPLIAGNWKMNGLSADVARIVGPLREAAAGLACDLLVCPPATLLALAAAQLAGTPVGVGAQDCHASPSGAHTGDLAAPMLREAGACWVILGHSERRAEHGEGDGTVRAKAVAAAVAGLRPIVCVGETEAERAAGAHLAVVRRQVAGSVPDGFAGVIAYEPVWAIGTGRTPGTAEVAEMHAAIRAALCARLGVDAASGVRILYGGSVKPENAAALLTVAEVGGALVGGASLDPAAFLAIARAVPPLSSAAPDG